MVLPSPFGAVLDNGMDEEPFSPTVSGVLLRGSHPFKRDGDTDFRFFPARILLGDYNTTDKRGLCGTVELFGEHYSLPQDPATVCRTIAERVQGYHGTRSAEIQRARNDAVYAR